MPKRAKPSVRRLLTAINQLESRVHKSECLLNQMNLRLGEYLEMIATKIESHAAFNTTEFNKAVELIVKEIEKSKKGRK